MTHIRITNNAILILIIIAASALRLYNLFDIPYTHDEFSALFRTYFNSFSELIEKGVKVDTLPAGVQVWLYFWTKLWGYSEWIVKLPFIICGIASVYLIYLIAKNWYNETVALISASFLSSIQYTIMYSQIARPYGSGLFFSLLLVYFWTKIILTPQRKFYLNSSLFIISATLCAYNHHFSLLFAAIVGISGLLFVRRQYLLKYIISNVIILLLYLPHIKITLYQLNMGGNEGWLGKFDNDFILNYFAYIFNFSILTYALVTLIILFGILKLKKQDINYQHLILFACWFFIPFLTGFFYSKYISNVLQYSVLIFSFPFLYFILFGHIKPQKTIVNLMLVLVILTVNIYSVIVVRRHYSLFYNSQYVRVLTDHEKAVKSNKSIVSIIDSDKNISNFYFEKLHLDTNFTWFDSFSNVKDLKNYLEKQSQLSDYLYFGCLSYNNPLSVPVILDFYPTLEKQNNYYGGTTYFFSKAETKETNIIEYQDFELKKKKFWTSLNDGKYVDSLGYSGKSSYLIDDKTEWSPAYSRSLDEIIFGKNDFIDFSVKVFLLDQDCKASLVSSLDSKGKNIHWAATAFDKFFTDQVPDGKWITIHHSLKLSDINTDNRDIQLKVYIWNKGKNNFLIDDFKVKLRSGNPVVYGLFEKIQIAENK
jgi:hypothetical protein